MCEKQETAKIIIRYPQRKEFILEAYILQQQLDASFDLSTILEEQVDECFAVVLNDTIIYSNPVENKTHIDHKMIFNALGEYKKPLVLNSEVPP